MDLLLASVPVMAQAFGAEPGAARHSVAAGLRGLAIGQLTRGPVSGATAYG